MNDNNNNSIRVAIIHTSSHKPVELERALLAHNICIAACAELSYQSLCEIDNDKTDAILVDLHDNAEQELDILETLLEQATLPLLFNDYATTEFNISISSPDWSKKLAQKLHKLVGKTTLKPDDVLETIAAAEDIDDLEDFEVAIDAEAVEAVEAVETIEAVAAIEAIEALAANEVFPDVEELPILDTLAVSEITLEDSIQANAIEAGASHVWVLGASLGGPLAVKEFLSYLPADLPVAFVLAQHIGESHIDLLGEQLDRATDLSVMTATPGHIINHSEVVLAPIEERILINEHGEISLHSLEKASIYTPSIDNVMEDIANTYQSTSGAIIFSGMGNDGEMSCQIINQYGGIIWAQEPNSCIISSMPDCARRTGYVSYSGTPQELALRLIDHFTE